MPFASLPFPFRNVYEVPCQGGGILGSAYDPLRVEVDPARRRYQAESLRRAEGVDAGRLADRRSCCKALDRPATPIGDAAGCTRRRTGCSTRRRCARRWTSSASRRACASGTGSATEAVAIGEGGGGGNGAEMGYARHMRGQNLLLARRLVEAGVPFVNVYDFKQQGQNWDAHFKGANQHKTHLLPQADQALSALIEDLDARGLLDTTLVVAMGEFGRTPKINGEARPRPLAGLLHGAAGRRRGDGRGGVRGERPDRGVSRRATR